MAPESPGKGKIEGVGEPLQAAGKSSRWEQFRLPVELVGPQLPRRRLLGGRALRRSRPPRRRTASSASTSAPPTTSSRTSTATASSSCRWTSSARSGWSSASYDVVLCSGLLYSVRERDVPALPPRATSSASCSCRDRDHPAAGGQADDDLPRPGRGHRQPVELVDAEQALPRADAGDRRLRGHQHGLGGGAPRALLAGLRARGAHRPRRPRAPPAPQAAADEPPHGGEPRAAVARCSPAA